MDIHEELIKSNELLSMQVWVLGGLIIFMLGVLGWFARSAWSDMKGMLTDHESRIQTVEKNERDTVQILKFTTNDVTEHKRLMAELSSRVDKLR